MHHEWQEVATTGTAVALAGAQEVNWLAIYAPHSNEFPIHVGKSTVTATGATTDGIPLIPGAWPPLKVDGADLADVFINGHATDGVFYAAASTD
tara:strand:+ start:12591 stop:12872 length:282 start_codon:yes stop_codon:yes gene_type:complete